MPSYQLVRSLRYNGTRYRSGDSIELTETVAQRLIERRYIARQNEAKPKRSRRRRKPTEAPTTETSPETQATPGIIAEEV